MDRCVSTLAVMQDDFEAARKRDDHFIGLTKCMSTSELAPWHVVNPVDPSDDKWYLRVVLQK